MTPREMAGCGVTTFEPPAAEAALNARPAAAAQIEGAQIEGAQIEAVQIEERQIEARPLAAGRFARTVGLLVDRLIDEQCPGTAEQERIAVRGYVIATVAAMPDYFRIGFHFLAWLFEFAPVIHAQARFSRMSPALQHAHVARWRGSGLGPWRSMIAFYASFAAYGLYSVAYPAYCEEPGRIAA